MIDNDAHMVYIVSQTKQNLEFLLSQGHISNADAQDMLGKLSKALQTKHLSGPEVKPIPEFPTLQSNTIPAPNPPAGATHARAIWAYNEQRQNPGDLTFYAGDVIEVIAETNADWWTGRCNGSEGLFPSTYVEKLPQTALSPYHPPQPRPQTVGYPINQYHPPPPNHYQVTNQTGPFSPATYAGPPPPGAQQVVAPSEPQKPPKKNFLSGSLGNTLAHSAVGGVGFGAGSAIGGGMINAIF